MTLFPTLIHMSVLASFVMSYSLATVRSSYRYMRGSMRKCYQ